MTCLDLFQVVHVELQLRDAVDKVGILVRLLSKLQITEKGAALRLKMLTSHGYTALGLDVPSTITVTRCSGLLSFQLQSSIVAHHKCSHHTSWPSGLTQSRLDILKETQHLTSVEVKVN